MTIEIIDTRETEDDSGNRTRYADIIIIQNGQSYRYGRGNLPLTGDLQPILDAEEAQLWPAAQAAGRPVDLYEIATKRVLKAFALVVMDELNILRTRAGLAPRTASQIDDAIRAKLKQMAR